MTEHSARQGDTANTAVRGTIKVGILRLEYIACPLCHSVDTALIQTSKDNLCGIPGEFKVEKCNKCQHRFMNPRPVAESLGDCYPDHYGPHQTNHADEASSGERTTAAGRTDQTVSTVRPLYLRILPLRYVPGLKRLYNWLIDDHSQPVPQISVAASADVSDANPVKESQSPPRALEIGCATGEYLIRLQAAGWKATGIEPGVRPAAIAGNRGLEVHNGMLESIDLQPASFDLAAAWMVIEHVPDPRDTLQRIHALLKPGGHLLFSIPNAGCWEAAFFGKNWFVLELPRHLHHFTPASIRTLLEQCGYTDINITHQRNLSNVVGSVALQILSRSPNSRFGRWLFNYPHRPTVGMKLLLAPWAHLVAWMRQGGRLTISAERVERSKSARMNGSEPGINGTPA
jgi:SAM-dependent methyltransferase